MMIRRFSVYCCCVLAIFCLAFFGLWAVAQDKPAQDKPAVPVPIVGIENLRQVAPGFLTGSQPEDAAAFQELFRRGIRVVISVDGATPDLEDAHKAGLRYVHIPIGYDKIGPQQRADLVEAVKSAGGPVYMHCHHGKHRGPAAAAYCGMALGKLSTTEAQGILKAAGTRADYTGLWDAIRKFEPPQVPAGPLVEAAQVEPITAAMVRIDHHWTGMEQQIKAEQIPDTKEFVQEALLLAEEFRELPRTSPTSDRSLQEHMKSAIKASDELHKAAQSADLATIKAASQTLLQSCADCHAKHRDH